MYRNKEWSSSRQQKPRRRRQQHINKPNSSDAVSQFVSGCDRPCGIVLRSERSTHGPRQKTERWTDGRSDGGSAHLPLPLWRIGHTFPHTSGLKGQTDILFLARCQVYNCALEHWKCGLISQATTCLLNISVGFSILRL